VPLARIRQPARRKTARDQPGTTSRNTNEPALYGHGPSAPRNCLRGKLMKPGAMARNSAASLEVVALGNAAVTSARKSGD